MIILRMQGGMGNQMFMYAFAKSIQRKTGERIWISTYQYRHPEEWMTPRQYALSAFSANREIRVIPHWLDEISEKVFQFKKKLLRIKNPGIIINDKESFLKATRYGLYYSDDMFRYYCQFYTNSRIKYVDGLFMSWKYFSKYTKEIKKCYRIVEPPSVENQEKLEEIKAVEAVCVHIRLGDYLSPKFVHSNYVCKEEYYLKGMNLIAEKVPKAVFYIFSTSEKDIEYIKKNYHFSSHPVRYIELNNPDYEELRLMKACKHFILSNSSFSWWAQYLCENKSKIVVAPNRWQNNRKQYTKDLYMAEWELIEV